MLVYHNGAGVLECYCGHIITGKHMCAQVINVQRLCIRECGFGDLNNECSICRKDDEQKNYDKQWYTDRDGYDRCSTCSMKCCYGDLPKQCECECD